MTRTSAPGPAPDPHAATVSESGTERRAARALSLAVTLGLAAALTVLGAPAASAHVTVRAESAAAGGYTVLRFRAPTESQDASTTALTVHLPDGTPFTSVRTSPVPGWSVELVESDLDSPVEVSSGATVHRAVTQIRWTADSAEDALAPGEFGEFPVSVGPLPDPGTVYFPVVQGYSDGTEVDWTQQAEGDADPEHPAPSLEVLAAGSGDIDEHGASSSAAEARSESAGTSESSGNGAALVIAIAALIVALIGAGLAGLALRRRG